VDDRELEVPVDDPVEAGVVDECAPVLLFVSFACFSLGIGSDGEGLLGLFGSLESSPACN